jgi:effector-binding domain-containing protein
MVPAYEALQQCIKDHGFEPVGVAIEEYWNDPNEVPPEELKTRIILLLKG